MICLWKLIISAKTLSISAWRVCLGPSERTDTSPTSSIWWSYDWNVLFSKTDQNCSSGTHSITGKFLLKISCGKPWISQPNLHQIQLSGTVSESSGRADSKTVIGFQIWPRFEGVIEVSLGDNWKDHCWMYLFCIYLKAEKLRQF